MELYQIDKIETPTLKISFRKSESVEVDEGFNDPEFITEKTVVTVDKIKLKSALKNGDFIIGARINHNLNLQIK